MVHRFSIGLICNNGLNMPALDDITIVDLTTGKAGALCTMLLGDNGARIVKIQLNSNDSSKNDPEFAILDRGKELYDFGLIQDANEFSQFLCEADVIVDDYGTFTNLVGYPDNFDFNDNLRLIHCSITGYGSKGPLKDEPAIPDLIKARIGLYESMPGFRPGSTHVIHPIADVGAGLLSALGISAALYARISSGLGRRVETSLYAGSLLYTPMALGNKVERRGVSITAFGGGPFYSVFECEDGKWMQIACIHSGFVDLAAAVMGIADMLVDSRFGDGRRPADDEAREELFNIVKKVMISRPSEEWASLFESADVPFALVGSSDEALNNEQVIHNGMIHTLQDPVFGPMIQYGLPIELSETPGEIKGARKIMRRGFETIPRLKESLSKHDPVFQTGSSQTEIRYDLPLDGLKVADITNVIAGPTAGRLMADLGADVIKIEPPHGDISRPSNPSYFHALNSNKKSLSIDAKNQNGSLALSKVVGQCDVLIANLRPGATDRMGLSRSKLLELNPLMIESHVTAFGWDGPFAGRPGLDPLAQAWMGLQLAQGGESNPPSFLGPVAPTDFTAGALAAYGSVLALIVRDKLHMGQVVRTNLLNAACMIVDGDFSSYEGKKSRRIADKCQNGLHDFHRLYKTANGWIYISVDSFALAYKLCEKLAVTKHKERIAQTGISSHSRLGIDISKIMLTQPTEYWISILHTIGIPVAESMKNYEVMFFEDPHPLQNGMVKNVQVDTDEEFKFSGELIQYGLSSHKTPLASADLGEHSIEILNDAGLDGDFIELLKKEGVVVYPEPRDKQQAK